jgi:2-polyprenyl-3-methyl-5-hydroxy-6-metoxy-1,4-benzoquinol methylase
MFGRTLDYFILRLFTHCRHMVTEEELNARANQSGPLAIDTAISKLQNFIRRLEGHFPLSEDLRYLDIGCGTGDMAIALAKMGCQHITGIDIVPRNIAKATLTAKQLQVDHCVEFICEDVHNWMPPHQYDVTLSHEALEHIDNPKAFLQKMTSLVAPNGRALLSFGPLFHSPVGDHMDDFFRILIPWRGVLFSEKAILRLRRECFRPTDVVDRYQDISGGLNLMRYSEFLQYVRATGWKFEFLSVNPQLKRFLPLYHLSNAFIQIPVVRDYFATSVYAILGRRSE